MHNLNTLRLM